MAKFVKLENGNYINIDEIVEIEKGECVYMREQLTESITLIDLDNILRASEENAIKHR